MNYININSLQIEASPKLVFDSYLNLQSEDFDKTYYIEIPNTSVNNNLLNNVFYNSNKVITFDAIYNINGITFTGTLFIKEITEILAIGVFTTSNCRIWNNLKQDRLDSLDLSKYNIILNKDNVLNSENDTPFIVFDLIDRGAFKETTAIDITDRYPSINLSKLLKEIFNKYEFGLDIEDNIGDFSNYYLIYTNAANNASDFNLHNSYLKASGENLDYNVTGDTTNFSINSKIEFLEESDLGNNFENSTYTIPKSGSYEVKFNYNFRFYKPQNATLSGASANIGIKVNGSYIKTKQLNIDLSSNYYFEVSGTLSSKPIYFNEGDTVEIWLLFSGNIIFSGTWNVGALSNSGSSLTIEPSEWYGYGDTIDISKVLPKLTISEFLKETFKLLNIRATLDTNNNVVKLIFGERKNKSIYPLNIWDYKEINLPKKSTILEFKTDKARPQPNKIIKVLNSEINSTKDLNFSRTLIAPCPRLFNSSEINIPVMWQVGDPLSGAQLYNPPKQKTLSNLRILKKVNSVSGNYTMTFGGSLSNDRVIVNSVLQFVEPDFRGIHLFSSMKENKIIECTAKLNFSDLHINWYFNNEFSLFSDEKHLLNGTIDKIEQIAGNIYKLTVIPTNLELIDNSEQDWFNIESDPSTNIQFNEDTSIFNAAVWGTITGTLSNQTDLQVALNAKENTIPTGTGNKYFFRDKTWKQIDYSEITNTPDTTNFVTKSGVETITGLKTFKNDDGVLIKNSIGSIKALKIGVTSSTSEYVGELRYDTIGANRVWLLPNAGGTIALTDDVLLKSVTLNSQTYLAPKTTTHRLSIGNSSYNLGDEVLLLKAVVAYGGSTALSFFEKDYNYHLLRLTHDGTLNPGRGLKLGGSGTISRRVISQPYIQFSYPSANDRSVSITLLEEPASSVNFYLPTADGTNGQVLTTNGAGQWSWSTVSGGGSYTVFTNTANGLVPAPNISDGTTKVLSHNGTTHSWTTLSTGITTRLRLNSGTYRSGDLTLQTMESNAVAITEPSSGVFQIVHSDTSTASSVETSEFNVIRNLAIDGFGHVTNITTRSLLPTTSNGYFLRDDGVWVSVSGGSSTFIGLSDTPSSYSGHGGKVVAVTADSSRLEFISLPTGSSHNPVSLNPVMDTDYLSFNSLTQELTPTLIDLTTPNKNVTGTLHNANITSTLSGKTYNGVNLKTDEGSYKYLSGAGTYVSLPTIPTYTSNNGITKSGYNFTLGGDLNRDTDIVTSGYYIRFINTSSSYTGIPILMVNNSNNPTLLVQNTASPGNANAQAIQAQSTNGVGIYATSTNSYGAYIVSGSTTLSTVHVEKNTSSNTNMFPILSVSRRSSNTPQVGFGVGIDFYLGSVAGGIPTLTGYIGTSWATVGTKANMDFFVNSALRARINHDDEFELSPGTKLKMDKESYFYWGSEDVDGSIRLQVNSSNQLELHERIAGTWTFIKVI